jgi:tetratricopeptide (TPR) repeat protein/DNA-binding CsgD family transcriptional regulator
MILMRFVSTFSTKAMDNLFTLNLLKLIFALVSLGLFGCKEQSRPNSPAADQLLSALLIRADSSSVEALQPQIALLPEKYQDSFFLKRISRLQTLGQYEVLSRTLNIYKKSKPGLLADCHDHFFQGVRLQYAGKFDSAQLAYARAISTCEQLGDMRFLANILDACSGNLSTQGRYDEALAMKYRAIYLYDTLGEAQKKMELRAHLANIFISKGEFDRAITLLENEIAFAETLKDTAILAYMWAAKGTAYGQKKDYANALLFHQKALAIRNVAPYTSRKAESLYHIGRILVKMGKFQASLDTLRVAEKLVAAGLDKQGIGFIQSGIGEALFNLNRYEEAYPYLEESLKTGLERKQYPAAAAAARMLSESHKWQQHFKDAFYYQEIYLGLKDSMFNQEKIKISQDLIFKYEANEKELKIAALEREKSLAAQRNWWISGLLLLLFAIVIYAFRLNAARVKQRLESENIKAEAQALQLQQALETQKTRLAANQFSLENYAKMLIDRNQQLNDLTLQIELGRGQKDPNPPKDSVNLYDRVILTESDWDNFQRHFNEVYPGYISALRTKYTKLTPAEIRLVLLDKMGLSLKETSAILGTSIEAIKKGRYRLKKKYDLSDENLSIMR